MRRDILSFGGSLALVLAAAALAAAPAAAQIGKQVSVRAGTAEDHMLREIQETRDPDARVSLIQEFLEEFGDSDVAILGHEMLMNHYWAEKRYEQAYASGEQIFVIDPDNFNTAVNLFRIAQEAGDTERMWSYGRHVGEIVQRYKQRPAPEGMSAEEWQDRQQRTLDEAASSINYVELLLFNQAYQAPTPAERAAQLEQFLAAFPDSGYAGNAQMLVAAAYQQTQQYEKMLEFAQGVIARDPNSYAMLLLLADYWSERGEALDQAEEYATKALELLDAMEPPETMTEEEWAERQNVQRGLAHSILGQLHLHRNRRPQAVEAFQTARPLLESDPVSYARNLYRLGFVLAQLRRTTEARRILTEAVSIESPYKRLAQETLDRIGGPLRP